MISLFIKHRTLLPIGLLVAFFGLVWLFPSAAGRLGMLFLLLSSLMAALVIVHKHRNLYLQGKTGHKAFLRNVLLEIASTGLAMLLASLLSRMMVEIVTKQIAGDLTRLMTGIAIGLLTGMVVGFVFRQTWGRSFGRTPAG